IIAIALAIFTFSTGAYDYWKEEGFIRRLSETIEFLHQQAIIDQAFYRLEFNLKDNTYKVGVLRPEQDYDQTLIKAAQDAGTLSLELAAYLNPSLSGAQTLIAPPSFPSLAKPVALPPGAKIEDIRTMRGKKTPTESQKAFIFFSPRGFSEFAVIHLTMRRGNKFTILINPFTGLTEVLPEYKDYEWTYGRNKKAAG
ncbi:MAG: hypothetical protein D6719_03825, partial [Candidatus Dadabacteria bacterium]